LLGWPAALAMISMRMQRLINTIFIGSRASNHTKQEILLFRLSRHQQCLFPPRRGCSVQRCSDCLR
jgi:hypothetical protein